MKKVHHSLADWDFQPDRNLWITTDEYVSPPSCLTLGAPGIWALVGSTFLKEALSGCLPDGKFITAHRFTSTDFSELIVYPRAQTVSLNDHPLNCYRVSAKNTAFGFDKLIDGALTNLASGNLTQTLSINTWYYYRVTFYEWVNASLARIFRVILEIWLDGEWVEQFSYDDPDNNWADSETNLIGFQINGAYNTYRQFIDDTEIWRKT